ncbi:MAG: thioesterase family protein [Pseudomonadota bacterium]|jgi:acyl-CoA thioesterase FadM|nr:thioesterase family protein [Pseudomonadota bacterium]MED5349340.1 thioesterase family protein [Pseudomonadota bacterium]
MKEKFPYLGNDVLITQDMCDLNEHMNVIYYAKIFEDEFPFYDSLGFTSDYFKQGYSFFTLEMNIRYLKEMRKGEIASPCFRYFAVKPKLIHYGGVLLNESGEVSSITENVLIHVDMNTRKSCEMSDSTIDHLKDMVAAHSATGEIDFELRLKI